MNELNLLNMIYMIISDIKLNVKGSNKIKGCYRKIRDGVVAP